MAATQQKSKKIPVVIVTNWRLDIVQGRAYGICSVEAPEEFKDHTFKRGFPLTDPTHTRCAVFALVMAMEQVLCSGELMSGKFHTVIVTKCKAAADFILGPRAETARKWASDPRRKPIKMSGFSKKFVQDLFGMMDILRAKEIADVVHIEESEEDKQNGTLLTEHTVHLDIDPEEDYGKPSVEKDASEDIRASDAKHRNLLRQELLILGARSGRASRQLSKKQRERIAQQEGHKKKKEQPQEKPVDKEEKTTTPVNAEPTTTTADDVPRPNPHSGLAAAIAAEELRAAAASAAATAGGGGSAAPGDGAGNVQEPEHGTGGGSGDAAQGTGERQAAAPDSAEHLA